MVTAGCTAMRSDQFQRYLDRDGGRCYHCGTTETLVPQHRLNRGMGGAKRLDRPSNVITLCSSFNGLVEADTGASSLALAMGWKIGGHPVITGLTLATIAATPVFDKAAGAWYILDDHYGRQVVDHA